MSYKLIYLTLKTKSLTEPDHWPRSSHHVCVPMSALRSEANVVLGRIHDDTFRFSSDLKVRRSLTPGPHLLPFSSSYLTACATPAQVPGRRGPSIVGAQSRGSERGPVLLLSAKLRCSVFTCHLGILTPTFPGDRERTWLCSRT